MVDIHFEMRTCLTHRPWLPMLAALFASDLAAVAVEEAVPTAFPKTRYESVRAHSPFALATVEAPPVTPQASFAANWFVGGIARIGDDDFVTIKSRDLATEFSLFAHETDSATGVTVASVNWTDVIGKSTVILRKGTETAKLEFNEEVIHAAPVAAVVAGKGGPPGPNGVNQPRTPPTINGQPMINGQQPQQRAPNGQMNPVIPNPVMTNPARQGAGAAPAVHRRAMVIQPPQ